MDHKNVQEVQLSTLLAIDLDSHFEQMVVTYQDRLYAFALERVRSRQVAEEIVLEALERAYYALKGYPASRIQILRLEPWLYEITRNVYYNYLRSSHTRNTRLPSVPLDLSEESTMLDIEDQSLEPDEVACRSEDQRELVACVSALPQRYQETIKLYYFEYLSYNDIAKRLQQPIGTVKSNIHRGTKLLRQILQVHMKEAK